MKYYVVSDVHGYYTLTKKALEEAGFFDEKEPCKLIVCGDLLDRGKEANKLIDFMMQLLEEDKLIYILGNHEDLFVECLQAVVRGREIDGRHYRNKTFDSMLQIAQMDKEQAFTNMSAFGASVMHSPFYQTLHLKAVDYYETKNYIFVHGWIPCFLFGSSQNPNYVYKPDWRESEYSSWRTARNLNGMDLACKHKIIEPNKTIVCGHWNTSYGHSVIDNKCSLSGPDAIFTPFSAEGILAIDASTPDSNMVNCVVIEDEELSVNYS